MIDIVLCTDDNYSVGCGVCVCSVLKHTPAEKCRFHILTKGLSNDNIRRFKQIEERSGATVEIVKIDDFHFDGLRVSDRFPVSIYYRYLAPYILSCDKSLYLDCDIVVCDDIEELWNVDLEGYALAAIEDQEFYNPQATEQRIGPFDYPYINSGVLLINHRYWREHDTLKALTLSLKDHETFKYPDQDALNFVLHSVTKTLPYKFNFQTCWFFPTYHRLITPEKSAEIRDARKSIAVVHFCGCTPWKWKAFCHTNNPKFPYFFKTLAHSPWRDYCVARHSKFFSDILGVLSIPLWAIDYVFNVNWAYRPLGVAMSIKAKLRYLLKKRI